MSSIRVVGEAADGRELLEMARNIQPDVILMELNLPNLSPFEALSALRREKLTTSIAIVTLTDDVQLMNAALENGVSGYIHKCDFAEEIATALQIIMSGKSFVSTQMCESMCTRLADRPLART